MKAEEAAEPSREGFGSDCFMRVGGPSGAMARGRSNERATVIEQFKRQADESLATHARISEMLGDRIRTLRLVQQLARQALAQRNESIAALPQDQAAIVRVLATRAAADRSLQQRLALALERFDQASADARALAELMAGLPEREARSLREAAEACEAFALPRLKGKLFGLTTFDQLFRNDALLNQMFPPLTRQSTNLLGDAPGKPPAPTRPPALPPRQAATPPRPTTGLLPAKSTPLSASTDALVQGVQQLFQRLNRRTEKQDDARSRHG